jgi:hypothetical protein
MPLLLRQFVLHLPVPWAILLVTGFCVRMRLEVAQATAAAAGRTAQGCTVSIGAVVLQPGHCSDLDAAVRDADATMYAAKHAGKNRVMLFAQPGWAPRQRPCARRGLTAPLDFAAVCPVPYSLTCGPPCPRSDPFHVPRCH